MPKKSLITAICRKESFRDNETAMGLAVKVYEAFKDDEKKAKVLSEVIDELESRIAPLRDVATKGDLEVTKLTLLKEIEQVRLSLQKEIEQVRGEIEQVRLSLKKEIEQVRGEVEQVRLSLQKEIEQVRLSLEKRIEEVRSSIIKWVVGLLVLQTGVIVSVIALVR